MKIVAVKDSNVRDSEWREQLKEWADTMEGRFINETPVGVTVTRDWIEYVEELEARVEELESETGAIKEKRELLFSFSKR